MITVSPQKAHPGSRVSEGDYRGAHNPNLWSLLILSTWYWAASSFVFTFHSVLCPQHVPGTVLGTGTAVMNKTDTISDSGSYILVLTLRFY